MPSYINHVNKSLNFKKSKVLKLQDCYMFTLQRGKEKSHRECFYLNYMVVFVPESYYLAMKRLYFLPSKAIFLSIHSFTLYK